MHDDDHDDWMWERARALLESAEHLQRRVFGLVPASGRATAWSPQVDVFDTGRELFALVSLPGVCIENIVVSVADDHMVVEGQRTLPGAFRNAHVHRLESPYGRFWRRVELPPGTYELRQKEVVQGCLVLRLAKLATK
ncbi:MAG: Hsp20/alpha crystallin family protein [Planctomycetota bacterium]